MLSFLANLAVVTAFPSYVPCASDAETLLRVGTHTCAATNKLKGSDIIEASPRQASLTASLGGVSMDSIIPGQVLDLELNTARFNWLLVEGMWMTVRVSDSGASGYLHGDEDVFQEAECPSQMSSIGSITHHITQMRYRAPCNASSKSIDITVVFSKCLFGCAQGVMDSGAVQPGQLLLTNLHLKVDTSIVDPSCSQEKPTLPPMPGQQEICETTQCWEGCEGEDVQEVPVRSLPVKISQWDREAKRYVEHGPVEAHLIVDDRWGAMTHGARTLRGIGDKAAPGEPLPPLYVSDINNVIFRLDNITLGGTARSSRAAWVVSPAHQHHIYDDEAKKLRGMIVASAQPFGVSPGNDAQEITQGGLMHVSPSGCHKLWPNKLDEPQHQRSGGVVNSVACHDASGVCFFNNWEHMFDETSEFPHCLHWCALDNATDPTRCTAGEPLAGGPNSSVIPGRFCAEPHIGKDGKTAYVATNGILLADVRQEGDVWHIDAIVSWTDGKSAMETGISFARKVTITVQRDGDFGASTQVMATNWEYFGTDVWRDTVAGTNLDVRLDHMWRDDAGYVWFSCFSKKHGAEHVLDYKTGNLLFTYSGFGKSSPVSALLPFNPSGIAVIGGFGQEGSKALVTVEAVPPLPGFKGGVFIVDIGNVPKQTNYLIS